jgi:hypothetical protein
MQVITKYALLAILFFACTSFLSASNEPIIVLQPNNISQCVGGNEALRVAISADLKAVYQWQQSSDNSDWEYINGATQATYTPSSEKPNKTWYRVLITTQGEGARAVASKSAEVTVLASPKVKIETVASKSIDANVTFIATRTGGAGTCTLQWQISENDAPWKNIDGATGDALKVSVSAKGMAKYKAVQRCTGSGCCN